MVEISRAAFASADEVVRPPKRVAITGRAFWVLFLVEGAVIAALLAAVVGFFASSVPLSAAADHALVREAILARATGAVLDPLVEIAPGLTAPASSVRGFMLNGITYYYFVEGEQSFDPLNRGVVTSDQVEVVFHDPSAPMPLVIYTLK